MLIRGVSMIVSKWVRGLLDYWFYLKKGDFALCGTLLNALVLEWHF